MDEFRREIRWEPEYNHHLKAAVPWDGGGHEFHIRWLLHGPCGTMQFLISNHWLSDREPGDSDAVLVGMGCHSDLLQQDEQVQGECDCRPAGLCYYNRGPQSGAEGVFRLLVTEGEEAVWTKLRNYYDNLFR